MVEVIVAAIVFTVAAGAILASMSRARFPVTEADHRLRAATFGKVIMDDLRARIANDTWSTAEYADSGPISWGADVRFAGYNAVYTITDDASFGGKHVSVTVSW